MDIAKLVEHVVRPIRNRIANMIARSVVQLVDDAKMQQLLQLEVLKGEPVPRGEHVQPYGFSSVPLAGAEAVVLFPNGDRGHPIVISVSDRRHRPTGGEAGEVTVYNDTGARITMTKDGDIIGEPAPGRDFLVRGPGGTAEALVKKSEHDGHTHPPGSFVAPGGGGPVTGVSGGAAAVTGTTVLKGE